MRALRIYVVFVLGLLALVLAKIPVQDERYASATSLHRQGHHPELRKTLSHKGIATSHSKAEFSLDACKAFSEHQSSRTDDRIGARWFDGHSLLRPQELFRSCAGYITQLKVQAEGCRQRVADLCQLLIFPHHWFW